MPESDPMTTQYFSSQPLKELPLWEKLGARRTLYSFELELTARCNLNCRHCYINLAAGDREALGVELPLPGIERIAEDAVSLGAIWCLLSGGEPLLRKDFFAIYLMLKKKGLLVSLFTNGTLITPKHVEFFKKYPPRDIEITVYGVTRETYESVSRVPGSFNAFLKGLDLLAQAGIPVSLKAMAMRSNLHEIPEIIRFSEKRSADSFRFDPFLHLRYDGDPLRNREIIAERLSPEAVVKLEKSYSPRFEALKKNCLTLVRSEFFARASKRLFRCGIGEKSFCVSPDGIFRFCSSIWHPQCVYDLKKGNVDEAWKDMFPRVREIESMRPEFMEKCCICPIINLCMWCPAVSYLETGQLDSPVNGFCRLAQARADAFIAVDKKI